VETKEFPDDPDIKVSNNPFDLYFNHNFRSFRIHDDEIGISYLTKIYPNKNYSVTLLMKPLIKRNLNKILDWMFMLDDLHIVSSDVTVLDRIESKSLITTLDMTKALGQTRMIKDLSKDLSKLTMLRLTSGYVSNLKKFPFPPMLKCLEIDDCQSESGHQDVWQDLGQDLGQDIGQDLASMQKVLSSTLEEYSGPIPEKKNILKEAFPALKTINDTKNYEKNTLDIGKIYCLCPNCDNYLPSLC
jgi:hypothetical protein